MAAILCPSTITTALGHLVSAPRWTILPRDGQSGEMQSKSGLDASLWVPACLHPRKFAVKLHYLCGPAGTFPGSISQAPLSPTVWHRGKEHSPLASLRIQLPLPKPF